MPAPVSLTRMTTVSPARTGALKRRFWPRYTVPGPGSRPAIAAEMTLARAKAMGATR